YYFLDEIEYEPDWEIWLDTIGDLRPDAKIVAASSAFCGKKRRNKEANESIKTIEISALSFFEYCRLTGVDVPDISDIASDLKFSHMTKHRMIELINSIAPVQNHFSRYLQRGGFPETSLAADQFSSQIIREKVVNKSIKEDILSISSVRNPTELEKIFLYLCGVTSEIVSIEAIAKNVESVSRPTVESYIEYIEDAGLIYMSDPIEIPPYKIQKSSPKIYIADAAIRSAILMGEPIGLVGDEARRLVEGAVYRAVRGSRRAGSIAGYLRGDHRGRSIDIAARHGDEYTLIDVRFDEEGTGPGDGIIYELAPAAGEAVVVTKNAGDFGLKKSPDGRMIAFIPAYAFLYLTGATRKLF
ncbi:MAG: hypothetical protein LBS53_14105, partial [Synergistaceae bacterium]|nr:hypothetical protein [Synergistaceae bacterium]